MSEGLVDPDPFRRVKVQQPLEQMQEPFIVLLPRRCFAQDLSDLAHAGHVLLARLGRVCIGEVQPSTTEVLGLVRLCFASEGIGHGTQHLLHHGQVFQVVVCLEQGFPRVELDEDTTYAPCVAGEGPSHVENDLWRSVVTCGDDLRVVLVVEGRATKIDETDVCIL